MHLGNLILSSFDMTGAFADPIQGSDVPPLALPSNNLGSPRDIIVSARL